MKPIKKRKLEAKGWKVGTVEEFLGLNDQEMALIEMKRSLMNAIREVRKKNKVTQVALAKLVETSQSRIAKVEAGETGISLDLICRVLLALGYSVKDIARAMVD